MNKILVDVYCPITGKHYDMYLPTTLLFLEAKVLMASIIEKQANHQFFKENQIVLCDYQTGKLIADNVTIQETKLKHGTQFILM